MHDMLNGFTDASNSPQKKSDYDNCVEQFESLVGDLKKNMFGGQSIVDITEDPLENNAGKKFTFYQGTRERPPERELATVAFIKEDEIVAWKTPEEEDFSHCTCNAGSAKSLGEFIWNVLPQEIQQTYQRNNGGAQADVPGTPANT